MTGPGPGGAGSCLRRSITTSATHPVHVGTGAEARTFAREDDRAGTPGVDERLRELADQLRVERVPPVGPRERDAKHGPVALDAKIRHDARA